MATKADFTTEEWGVLQWAVADAITYTSLADPGFWASFSEAGAAAKFIAGQRGSSPSLLVRDLSGDIKAKPDSELTNNRTDIAGEASSRIEQAAGIVADKAPDELEAFKAFILGVADAAAEGSKGISAAEQTALDRIKTALG
jgi:hypothetical protein